MKKPVNTIMLIKANFKSEGIDMSFIQNLGQIQVCGDVQLLPGTEPVRLLECSKGFWVMYEFGEFLKDEEDKLVIITKKEARIAKIRYLFNYKTPNT